MNPPWAPATYPLGCHEMRRTSQSHGLLPAGYTSVMETLLWLVAVVLVITGIVGIVRGAVLWGIALIVAGLLIGPGGVSILS